ncbi:hypothetical protein KQ51_00097 [Candidatus Izimaplasma bacterium HR1]|jgi:DNA-directed RNA polymerase subunit RPC12/RpoP|uniref:hypothetical protein n=1 Tax=Candidatus Izimoplasma sp. HR1 TaxID=1541959 RepID=UPI0004F849FC|nr:hypothetical protein KQ51_00097 [Candidatus Izimaplasma bacterium HR1]
MARLTMQCEKCGKSFEIDSQRDFAFCVECGHKNILRQSKPIQTENNSNEKVNLGKKYFKSGNYARAFELANDVLVSSPMDIEANILSIKSAIEIDNANESTFTDPIVDCHVEEILQHTKDFLILNDYNVGNHINEIGEPLIHYFHSVLRWLAAFQHDNRFEDVDFSKSFFSIIEIYLDLLFDIETHFKDIDFGSTEECSDLFIHIYDELVDDPRCYYLNDSDETDDNRRFYSLRFAIEFGKSIVHTYDLPIGIKAKYLNGLCKIMEMYFPFAQAIGEDDMVKIWYDRYQEEISNFDFSNLDKIRAKYGLSFNTPPKNAISHVLIHNPSNDSDSSIHFKNQITQKMMDNFISKFKNFSYNDGDDVIALVDTTVLGSCKKGMLITTSAMYINEGSLKSLTIPFSSITQQLSLYTDSPKKRSIEYKADGFNFRLTLDKAFYGDDARVESLFDILELSTAHVY